MEKITEYKSVPKIYILLASIVACIIAWFLPIPILNPFWLISAWVLSVFIVMVVAHEYLHGILFQKFTGRVVYGFLPKKLAFYASSPNSVITRNRFILIALFPQLLTVLSLIIMWIMSANQLVFYLATMFMVCNLLGGVSDLWVVSKLFRYPNDILCEDTKTGLILYKPVAK